MTANTAFGVSTPVNSRSINNAFDAVLNNGYDFSNIVATGTITAAGNIGWSSTTYFKPVVAGNFGSVQVQGDPNAYGWQGYNINGNATFISSSTQYGLIDDTNDEWGIRLNRNDSAELFFNGTSRFQTTNIGANTTGSHSFATGQGAVIKAVENRLVNGSNQSAAMYLGDNSSGNTATGGIEVSWDASNTNPIIGIGVTRDTRGTKITMDYAGVLRFFSIGTEKLSITSTQASFSNTLNAPSVVASGSTWRSSPVVNGAGITYPNATVGGGTANEMGLRWASPNINGTVDNAVSAVLGTVSDRRFKTNIETLQIGLATVKQLRPVTYNPLDVIGFDENNQIIIGDKDPYETVEGFIADEVEQVAPWLVQGGENGGYQSVNYALITPMLVKAIQELDQRLTEMEAA